MKQTFFSFKSKGTHRHATGIYVYTSNSLTIQHTKVHNEIAEKVIGITRGSI